MRLFVKIAPRILGIQVQYFRQRLDCASEKEKPRRFCAVFTNSGRSERIRTSDTCVPNAVLYQAELHSVLTVK